MASSVFYCAKTSRSDVCPANPLPPLGQSKYSLSGFVYNSSDGVVIEVEGEKEKIKKFLENIEKNPPSRAKIKEITKKRIAVKKEKEFRIIDSLKGSKVEVEISPDIATCDDCLSELFNPSNRRYLFPFINCINCGPRFTITKNIPYDRKNTTMAEFTMCENCEKEYNDPENRRYHTQPNCCFDCGPEVFFKDRKGEIVSEGVDGIRKAAKLIEEGEIVAIKGIGGYHLCCNAIDEKAIKKLRERKRRFDKPFALMAKDIKTIEEFCYINKYEKKLLTSWQSPIVLLKKKNNKILEEVAPLNNYIGFMLPYSPIHHLLFFFLPFLVLIDGEGCIKTLSAESLCIAMRERSQASVDSAPSF